LYIVQGPGEARILLSSEDFVSNETEAIEILLDADDVTIRSIPSLTVYNSTNVSFFIYYNGTAFIY
jgi:hypothetical protein